MSSSFRSLTVPAALNWEDLLTYTAEKWGRLDIRPTRYSAELDTERNIWASNAEEFLREVRPVWGLVESIHVEFHVMRPHRIGTTSDTAVRLLLVKDDMEEPLRLSVHVDGPSQVVREGVAAVLMEQISEWVRAQAAMLPPVQPSVSALDEAAGRPSLSRDDAAPTASPNAVSTSHSGSMPSVRVAGSMSVGILVGLSFMSVYAFGWTSGPSVILLALLVSVLAAILVHRFGWNR